MKGTRKEANFFVRKVKISVQDTKDEIDNEKVHLNG